MKKHAFHSLLISILCLLVYLNSFGGSLHYDDFFAITGNAAVRDLQNAGEIFRLFPGRFILMYSFAINYFLGGQNPFGYHVANFLFHLANALLVYFLATILFRRASPETETGVGEAQLPLIAALLFAVHPAMTESVTYVAGRASSLAATFFLGSLLLYMKGQDRPQEQPRTGAFRMHLYLLSLLVFFLSLWVKESNATLPVTLILCDFFFIQTGKWRRLKYSAAKSLPYFLALAGILLWRKMYLGVIGNPLEIRSFSVNLLTQLRVAVMYLRLMFLPVGQNIDYDISLSHSPGEPAVVLSFLFLCALALSTIPLMKRNRVASFGVLWFLITLAPTSVVPLWDVMSERWLYLPAIGIILAVVSFLPSLHKVVSRALPGKRVPAVAVGLLILLMGAATVARNQVWKNEYTLWKDAAEKSPNKERPHANLAMALAEKGDVQAAVAELNQALSINPASPETNFSLGALYLKMGKYDEAITLISSVLSRYPEGIQIPVRLADDFAKAHFNLGVAFYFKGKFEQAISEYRQALSLAPYLPWVHSNLGVIYETQGTYELALAEYRKELELRPGTSEVMRNIEIVKRKMRPRR